MNHSLTIQYWLQKHAQYRPKHLALIFEDKRISYLDLYHSVNQLCHAFKQAGIEKGDKVATLLSNSVELWEIYWACAACGAVAVPLSPLLRGEGLQNLLQDADTKLVITNQCLTAYVNEIRQNLPQIPSTNFWVIDANLHQFQNYHQAKNEQPTTPPNLPNIESTDCYNIIYSSGTTGMPKGIVINHGVRSLYGSLFANAFRMTPESVVMHSGSIIFNGSFLTLMPAMFLGCTYVLMSHFDAKEVVSILHNEKVTHTILVPSQIIGCLQQENFNKEHLPSIEYILSVGAPLLLEHKQALNRQLPGVFYELYGLTEGFMTILDRNDATRKTGSVGYPSQFMHIRIVDEQGNNQPNGNIGEIVGKSPLLMDGYYKNEALTKEAIRDGWLYTGDLGYIDDEGFLFLTGRKKDLIISGGVNVYPTDIEEILIRHPRIKDVAVFGIPHEEWGETPVAAVVLDVESTETATQILAWANQNLGARYQKINQVFILKELPRNVAGKVLKRELRERFSDDQNIF
ncbi:MAG: hypothetical protein RLY16_1673 [Bacteroidota bacterium]